MVGGSLDLRADGWRLGSGSAAADDDDDVLLEYIAVARVDPPGGWHLRLSACSSGHLGDLLRFGPRLDKGQRVRLGMGADHHRYRLRGSRCCGPASPSCEPAVAHCRLCVAVDCRAILVRHRTQGHRTSRSCRIRRSRLRPLVRKRRARAVRRIAVRLVLGPARGKYLFRSACSWPAAQRRAVGSVGESARRAGQTIWLKGIR